MFVRQFRLKFLLVQDYNKFYATPFSPAASLAFSYFWSAYAIRHSLRLLRMSDTGNRTLKVANMY
jgi:hypothetical protein